MLTQFKAQLNTLTADIPKIGNNSLPIANNQDNKPKHTHGFNSNQRPQNNISHQFITSTYNQHNTANSETPTSQSNQ